MSWLTSVLKRLPVAIDAAQAVVASVKALAPDDTKLDAQCASLLLQLQALEDVLRAGSSSEKPDPSPPTEPGGRFTIDG